MATATGTDQQLSSPKTKRRSPPGTGARSSLFAQGSNPPIQEENADGEIYRTRRTRVELHAGDRRTQRKTFGLAGGGNERAGADRGAARDSEEPALVPGRRDAVGVAVRGAGAARGGANGGGGRQEPGPEDRQAGRVCPGGEAADRITGDEGLQEPGPVQAAEGTGEELRLPGRRHGAGEEPAQERAALERSGLRRGALGLLEARPGGVVGQAAGSEQDDGRVAVRGARRTRGIEGEGREGVAGGSTQASRVACAEDVPGSGSDPDGGAPAGGGDAVPVPEPEQILGVLRTGRGDAELVGLGAGSGWAVGKGTGTADAGAESELQPHAEACVQGRGTVWAPGRRP